MSRRVEIFTWGTMLLLAIVAFGGSWWAVVGLCVGFLLPPGRREG